MFALKPSRNRVNQAHGTQTKTPGRDEWSTGVETDKGHGGHLGIIREPGVPEGVGDHEHVVRKNSVDAEGDFPVHFGRAHAGTGFEPLAIFIDQRDEGDGDMKMDRRPAGELVKAFFRRGVEDAAAAQGFESGGFARGEGGGDHRKPRGSKFKASGRHSTGLGKLLTANPAVASPGRRIALSAWRTLSLWTTVINDGPDGCRVSGGATHGLRIGISGSR